MQEAIDKAAALIEAHQYIRSFAGKTVVVKVGGSIMDEPDTLAGLVEDVCFMAAVGISPMIVHGGGKAISQAMQEAGLEAQFVQGRRYTDQRTLAIVEHVLCKQVNAQITELIEGFGHRPMGVHTLASCAVFGRRLFLEPEPNAEGSNGDQPARTDQGTKTAQAAEPARPAQSDKTRRIDIGLVGQVDWINAKLLHALTSSGLIPVIAPLGLDRGGGKLNINADSVAGHVAAATQAEKLVLISDTHGIRQSEDVNDLAGHLRRSEIEKLTQRRIITAGMLPKVEAAFTALSGEVGKTHIIDGRIPHSLLLEVYTQQGVGTEIVM